jgi:hypothetical protein
MHREHRGSLRRHGGRHRDTEDSEPRPTAKAAAGGRATGGCGWKMTALQEQEGVGCHLPTASSGPRGFAAPRSAGRRELVANGCIAESLRSRGAR